MNDGVYLVSLTTVLHLHITCKSCVLKHRSSMSNW